MAPAPPAGEAGVAVLSETGKHEICTIPLDKGESVFCDELLAMICSTPKVQDLFPRAQPSTFKLCGPTGVAIQSYVMLRPGDVVFLHSNKDAGAVVAASAPQCVVLFRGVELIVPHAPEDQIAVLEWACEMFHENPCRYALVKADNMNVLIMQERCYASAETREALSTTVRSGDAVLYAPYPRNRAVMIRHWACHQLNLNVHDYELVDNDLGDFTLVKKTDDAHKGIHEIVNAFPVKDPVSERQVQVVVSGYIPLVTSVLKQACEDLFLDAALYDLSGPPGHAEPGKMLHLKLK